MGRAEKVFWVLAAINHAFVAAGWCGWISPEHLLLIVLFMTGLELPYAMLAAQQLLMNAGYSRYTRKNRT